MIHTALSILRQDLNAYLGVQANPVPSAGATLFNISNLADNNTGNDNAAINQLLISLVNIEEESAFKNLPNTSKTMNGGVQYANPPVHLNLYILFAANFDNYENSLRYLSYCIRFFQGKHSFNLKNTPAFTPSETLPETLNMRLSLDLYTMTFEQINHLWGSLGGRQIPFVMYKARLVQMIDRRVQAEGPLIEEIGREERVL